jgi:tRNA threonylcarbamoyladenosine biosynthesis protein TsaB
VILGLDTATPSTAVALWAPGGPAIERRDDPPAGQRPGHGARLLALVHEALAAAGAGWGDVERIAAGVGPGGFTGLRLGIATARALAQANEIPLVGVSSLEALARGAGDDARGHGGTVVAVIDARRGEVFAAAWHAGERVIEPAALAPEALAARLAALDAPLAVGDGAVRFRTELARAGAIVPQEGSPAHRLSALEVCRLGADAEPGHRNALLPDYRREPDAKPPRPS